MNVRYLPPVALSLFLLTACGTEKPFTDDGAVCITASQSHELTVAPGEPLEVTVALPFECLSSTCNTYRGNCSASVDGDTIRIRSKATIETSSGIQGCTEDCGLPVTTCSLRALEPGTYKVVHGDDEFTLELPGNRACGGPGHEELEEFWL